MEDAMKEGMSLLTTYGLKVIGAILLGNNFVNIAASVSSPKPQP